MNPKIKNAIIYWFKQAGEEQKATDFFDALPVILERMTLRESELNARLLDGRENPKDINKVLGVLVQAKQELERLK